MTLTRATSLWILTMLTVLGSIALFRIGAVQGAEDTGINGRVIDADGNGLSTIIHLSRGDLPVYTMEYRTDEPTPVPIPEPHSWTTTSTADGAFRFQSLPPGILFLLWPDIPAGRTDLERNPLFLRITSIQGQTVTQNVVLVKKPTQSPTPSGSFRAGSGAVAVPMRREVPTESPSPAPGVMGPLQSPHPTSSAIPSEGTFSATRESSTPVPTKTPLQQDDHDDLAVPVHERPARPFPQGGGFARPTTQQKGEPAVTPVPETTPTASPATIDTRPHDEHGDLIVPTQKQSPQWTTKGWQSTQPPSQKTSAPAKSSTSTTSPSKSRPIFRTAPSRSFAVPAQKSFSTPAMRAPSPIRSTAPLFDTRPLFGKPSATKIRPKKSVPTRAVQKKIHSNSD